MTTHVLSKRTQCAALPTLYDPCRWKQSLVMPPVGAIKTCWTRTAINCLVLNVILLEQSVSTCYGYPIGSTCYHMLCLSCFRLPSTMAL